MGPVHRCSDGHVDTSKRPSYLHNRAQMSSAPPVLFHETLELLAPARVAELPERLGLDLSDALARYIEFLPHFFQGVVGILPDAEPPAKHLFLPLGEGA